MAVKIILLSLLTFSFNAFANPCTDQYKESDKTYLPGKVDLSKSCQLLWKSKSGAIEGLETVYIKDTCKRYEDGETSSCIMTRHCPVKKEEFPESGLPLFLTKKYLSGLCETNKANEYYSILKIPGSSNKRSIQAYVHCQKRVPKAIVLSNGQGENKVCKLPSLK